jgi:glycerol-3-phosphate acyltransferase PlsY
MELRWIAAWLFAYLIGSIPTGLVVVRMVRGRDIRYWFSGRTGGTNVMRMAGFWAGLATSIGDLLKGLAAVSLARALTPSSPWGEVVAGLLVVIGHNYSLFLVRFRKGKLELHGGAGGATTAGAAAGLWLPAVGIIVPLAVAILFGVGYASVATMSIAIIAALIFLWRTLVGLSPWAYIVFAIAAEFLLLWALRPNIQRLLRGEERLVGWRAARRNKTSTSISNSANSLEV